MCPSIPGQIDPAAFGFDTILDGERTSDRAQRRERQRPVHTDSDLVAAREQAFADGVAEGQRRVIASLEQDSVHVMQRIASGVEALRSVDAVARQASTSDVATVSMAIAKQLAGAALAGDSLSVIEPVITDCLDRLYGETVLVVRVHPDLVDPLQHRITKSEFASGFAAEVQISAGHDLARGDCRVEWRGGCAERVQRTTWADVETVVARYIAFDETAETPTVDVVESTDEPIATPEPEIDMTTPAQEVLPPVLDETLAEVLGPEIRDAMAAAQRIAGSDDPAEAEVTPSQAPPDNQTRTGTES